MNDNKRIALNTSVLYIKLIISIIIGLYVSRLILLNLGSSDYGLYSVVGGIVTLLNIAGITMVTTSYRYISVEIGKGENGDPNKVYNTVLVIHICLALLLLLIGLIVGIWYIDHYLNVAANKIPDAKFVFIVSLVTAVFAIISVPSNGLIIAKEKFVFTSTTEIIQSFIKLLLVVFILQPYIGNKLRLYAVLLALVNLTTPIAYTIYCIIKERRISKWNFNRNKGDYKEIIKFTWWILIGAVAFIGSNQGVAVIINLFFGTIINAAFGVANQVQSYILQFVRNLSQVANPQIMKNIGGGNEERSLHIVYKISKYSYFIMLMPAVPVLLSMKEILYFWLKEVPPYTAIFTALWLINGIIGCVSSGFDAVIQASGKVRKNQTGYAIINLSLLPIIYILYKLGFPSYSNGIVMMILTIITIAFQSYIMKNVSKFKVRDYLTQTIIPALKVGMVIIPLIPIRALFNDSLSSVIVFTLLSEFWILTSIYLLGLDTKEKDTIVKLLKLRL